MQKAVRRRHGEVEPPRQLRNSDLITGGSDLREERDNALDRACAHAI
jgi:hypothetical protein